MSGSSPLTRGKLHESLEDATEWRLIPAHAGKTAYTFLAVCTCGAHPRSRGENLNLVMIDEAWAGSSPLTRGKRGWPLRTGTRAGLIPAHAGKTMVVGSGLVSGRAHPRSRGENRSPSGVRVGLGGSSPLTRGKLRVHGSDGVGGGLIPAHAGKTCRPWSRTRPKRAHPRSRGENKGTDRSAYLNEGSSPLTRGKLTRMEVSSSRKGLIPAHAGKTSSSRR